MYDQGVSNAEVKNNGGRRETCRQQVTLNLCWKAQELARKEGRENLSDGRAHQALRQE